MPSIKRKSKRVDYKRLSTRGRVDAEVLDRQDSDSTPEESDDEIAIRISSMGLDEVASIPVPALRTSALPPGSIAPAAAYGPVESASTSAAADYATAAASQPVPVHSQLDPAPRQLVSAPSQLAATPSIAPPVAEDEISRLREVLAQQELQLRDSLLNEELEKLRAAIAKNDAVLRERQAASRARAVQAQLQAPPTVTVSINTPTPLSTNGSAPPPPPPPHNRPVRATPAPRRVTTARAAIPSARAPLPAARAALPPARAAVPAVRAAVNPSRAAQLPREFVNLTRRNAPSPPLAPQGEFDLTGLSYDNELYIRSLIDKDFACINSNDNDNSNNIDNGLHDMIDTCTSQIEFDHNTGACNYPPHPSAARSRELGVKSGATARSIDLVKSAQRWAHAALPNDFNAESNLSFTDLDFRLLVAGEMEIILECQPSQVEVLGRLNLIRSLANLLGSYSWAAVRSVYAAVLRKIEQGSADWSSDILQTMHYTLLTADRQARATAAPAEARGQPYAGKRKSGANSGNTAPDKIWFCSEYQRGACPLKDAHQKELYGKLVTVQHVCAKCLLKDRREAKHPDTSSVCPHYSA
ncbi:MAG: hypothetical protein DRN30_06460 [Thermoplasmata archaeon]|nr:MAG: hypothetical protein DRN30_06460 [Thermoplasmata archaeon]